MYTLQSRYTDAAYLLSKSVCHFLCRLQLLNFPTLSSPEHRQKQQKSHVNLYLLFIIVHCDQLILTLLISLSFLAASCCVTSSFNPYCAMFSSEMITLLNTSTFFYSNLFTMVLMKNGASFGKNTFFFFTLLIQHQYQPTKQQEMHVLYDIQLKWQRA